MAAFRDMEELCQGLLSLLGANHAEAQQRRLLGRHGQMMERMLETQDGAEQQLRGEGLGQRGGGSAARALVLVMGGGGQVSPANPSLLGGSIPCPISGGTSGRALLTLSLSFPAHEMGFGTAATSKGLVVNIQELGAPGPVLNVM